MQNSDLIVLKTSFIVLTQNRFYLNFSVKCEPNMFYEIHFKNDQMVRIQRFGVSGEMVSG